MRVTSPTAIQTTNIGTSIVIILSLLKVAGRCAGLPTPARYETQARVCKPSSASYHQLHRVTANAVGAYSPSRSRPGHALAHAARSLVFSRASSLSARSIKNSLKSFGRLLSSPQSGHGWTASTASRGVGLSIAASQFRQYLYELMLPAPVWLPRGCPGRGSCCNNSCWAVAIRTTPHPADLFIFAAYFAPLAVATKWPV